MNIPHQSEKPGKRPPPRVGLATAAFILLFAVLLFLLVQSMVLHHFISGGRETEQTNMPSH